MSVINPQDREYESHDGFKVAKDIAWVVRTLWGGAVVFVLATAWVVALAQDVKSNTEKAEEAATKEQVAQVLDALTDIKGQLRDADTRQREIQTDVAKLESDVETLKDNQ